MITVEDVKLAVIKSAFGMQALPELEFLHALESLYLDAYARGTKDGFEAARNAVLNPTQRTGADTP